MSLFELKTYDSKFSLSNIFFKFTRQKSNIKWNIFMNKHFIRFQHPINKGHLTQNFILSRNKIEQFPIHFTHNNHFEMYNDKHELLVALKNTDADILVFDWIHPATFHREKYYKDWMVTFDLLHRVTANSLGINLIEPHKVKNYRFNYESIILYILIFVFLLIFIFLKKRRGNDRY